MLTTIAAGYITIKDKQGRVVNLRSNKRPHMLINNCLTILYLRWVLCEISCGFVITSFAYPQRAWDKGCPACEQELFT